MSKRCPPISAATAAALGVLLCACASTPLLEEDARPTLTIERVVRFEHRLVNKSDRPARLELFLALPRDNERQQVRYLAAGPTPAEELTDEYGNRILHYIDEDVPPGDVVAHGWIAEVAISSYVFHPAMPPSVVELSPAQSELFLRDSPNYRLDSNTIADLVTRLMAGDKSDAQRVRSFFRYLIENVRYERDDVWDPAPKVLERGSGSCSEFNYAFVALCRSAGIPARWTGGIVLGPRRESAYDPSITEDAVFHRWSEVFLPGQGWFPVDCSRASGERKRYGNPENYFGRLPAGLLQCVRGDGAGSSPLGWDYLSNQLTPYEAKDWSGKVGFWISGVVPGRLEARVAAVRQRLAGAQDRALFDALVGDTLDREILFLERNLIRAEALPDLVGALLAARHPGAIYWSLLARQRGLALEPELEYQTFCDEYLNDQINRYYRDAAGSSDLFTFEYWWRKARSKTRWSEEKQRFVLTSRSINIY